MNKFFLVDCLVSLLISLPFFFWLDYRIGQELEALAQQCARFEDAEK